MREKEVQEFLESLSIKNGSKLRGLFYNNKGLPKFRTYDNVEILKRLGLKIDSLNALEYSGAIARLAPKLSQLRNEAKKHGLAWTDAEPKASNGHAVAYHGFTDDTEKLDSTMEKYNSLADRSEKIAETTSKVCKKNIRLINFNKKLESKAG